MIVMGINGSPDKNGNTSFIINEILKKIKAHGHETYHINAEETLNDLHSPFCTACTNPCTGICYKNKKLSDVFELMKKADAFILGSPSYFGTMSGQLKCFFDKTRTLRSEKALYNKLGAAVCVGASRFGGQETTIKAIHDLMLVHGMYIIGDGYISDDCGHHGVCAQKPSEEDIFAIKRSDILAKRILECINYPKK
ncbi:MAG: flavodoxin family protein [Clostridiales bacterium]